MRYTLQLQFALILFYFAALAGCDRLPTSDQHQDNVDPTQEVDVTWRGLREQYIALAGLVPDLVRILQSVNFNSSSLQELMSAREQLLQVVGSITNSDVQFAEIAPPIKVVAYQYG